MVSILPNTARDPWQVISQQIGQDLRQQLPGAVQQGYNRGQLQSSLAKIGEISQNPSSSPLDITLAAMQAGAGIPGSEKYLGAIIPELVKFAEARRLQQASLPGEEQVKGPNQQRQDREHFQPPQQGQQLPDFLNKNPQQTEFFPTHIPGQGGIGNAPQAATTGKKIPMSTPAELSREAKRLSADRTKNGIPTTPQDALKELLGYEDQKKLHNAEVDLETNQRKQSQKDYGDLAVEKLNSVFKGANDEIKSIFKKKGEELAKSQMSEADIERSLATEARNFKNSLVNVEKEMDAPRLYNAISRGANSSYKNFEDSVKDMRLTLKPLLSEGLYDTARDLLSKKGYGLEEREMIINPMGEREKTIMNRVPIIRPTPKGLFNEVPGKGNIEDIKSTIKELKIVNPNFSPVLARKQFEDKGYDWRDFKNAWNALQEEGFELTDDQFNQSGNLNSPPLGNIEKILHGLNFTGR